MGRCARAAQVGLCPASGPWLARSQRAAALSSWTPRLIHHQLRRPAKWRPHGAPGPGGRGRAGAGSLL